MQQDPAEKTARPENSQAIANEIIHNFVKGKPAEKSRFFRQYYSEVLPDRELLEIKTDYEKMEIELQFPLQLTDEENADNYSAQVFVLKYLQKKFPANQLQKFARSLKNHKEKWEARTWLDQRIISKEQDELETAKRIKKLEKRKTKKVVPITARRPAEPSEDLKVARG